MNSNNEKVNLKISDSTLKAIQEAKESYNRLAKNIVNIIPKIPNINIPKFKLPKNEMFIIPDPGVTREQNTWKRHKELLDVENAVLEIQTEILKEQKSTTILTKWILLLTIIGIIVTILINFKYA